MASLTDSRPDLGSDTRVHGLDALRAGALLLGIGLHSLLPFLPGLPWLVSDTRSTWLAGVPVYVIHLFRMALFMLLAGYFGRLTLQRRGPGRYLRDRMIRILLPLVVFWPVAVLSLGVLAVINAQANGIPLVVPPPPQGPPLLMINPGQLWFLLVLMQCVAIMLAIRGLAVLLLGTQRCRQLAAWCGGLLSHPAGGLLAAVPYTAALILQGTVLGGIIAPATLLPSLPPVTAYLGAFTVGWALHARADAMTRIARFWPVHLTGAVVLSAIGLSHSDPGSTTPLPLAAAGMAVAAWCWVYALLGLGTRFLRRERPAVRYLADASYWMYLIHLPLLVGFEILLVRLDWPIMVKLTLTWLVVGTALVVSYHLLVRSTPIGRWLNRRRYPFRLPWGRTKRRATNFTWGMSSN